MKLIKKLTGLSLKHQLTNEKRKSIVGVLFCLPFIIGFILFFLHPFLQAIRFSISELEITRTGYNLLYVGINNYRFSILEDPGFIRTITESLMDMLRRVPLILSFSFFIAVILNQEFKGRALARIIFFLPVILASGAILQLEQNDFLLKLMEEHQSSTSTILSGPALIRTLFSMNIPEAFQNYIMVAIEYIPTVIRASGVQILIFLAGLQSVPKPLYEAADVEGATRWESFWKITLPMLSPIILTNLVYTIIDSFVDPGNPMINKIRNEAFRGAGFGISVSMSMMYFVAISIILAITVALISRWVFYQE
ncbi:MAG: carbohydrate ABC transporter permease [Bacillota bacterium]